VAGGERSVLVRGGQVGRAAAGAHGGADTRRRRRSGDRSGGSGHAGSGRSRSASRSRHPQSAAGPGQVRGRCAAAVRGHGARHPHGGAVRACPGRPGAWLPDLRARAGAVRRAGVGGPLAHPPAAPMAVDRDQPARRPGAHHERAACGRAGRQLREGPQLPGRPPLVTGISGDRIRKPLALAQRAGGRHRAPAA
jgi:hypothetical protein